MPRLLPLVLATGVAAAAAATSPRFAVRAAATAGQLINCSYDASSGVFANEGLWESGNTIESLAISMMADSVANNFTALFTNTYLRTPIIVDSCFDDHQWWELAWVRAFQATGEIAYLERAAQVFDYVAVNAWTPLCGGGVLWCPGGNYKNAITNELFLTSAMELHAFASVLGKPSDYYLTWANKTWDWLASTGMINSDNLVNDGLDAATCQNNKQTTWTYNQGVLLDGLTLLSAATGNASAVTAARAIANAAMTMLTTTAGILAEPCGSGGCDGDQLLFKGIFVRHLARMAGLDASISPNATAFLVANAASLIQNGGCADASKGAYYGLLWQGPCTTSGVATASAALDALTAAAILQNASAPTDWRLLGVGNCIDDANHFMNNCHKERITETECQQYAKGDAASVGYDYDNTCGVTSCRVRTLGGAAACNGASGWEYSQGPGNAVNITKADGRATAFCVLPPLPASNYV